MQSRRSPLQFAVLAVVAMLLSGCAALGVQPQTFNQRLAVGYAGVEAVGKTTTTLLDAGRISRDDASNVLTTARTALAGLDIAAKAHATDPAAADARLTATIATLTALQTYLATQEKR